MFGNGMYFRSAVAAGLISCTALAHHGRGLIYDAKKETLTEFLTKEKMPWTHWWNGASGGIVEDWDVQFYPTIYVLDANGVIRYRDVRGEKLEEAVDHLLKEMKDKAS